MKYFNPGSHYERLKEVAVACYDYHSESGQFLYRKLRIENADGSKRFPIFTRERSGKYVTSATSSVERTLYRWPTHKTRVVVICEGEKDVHTIEGLRLRDSEGNPVLATTTGGSTTWMDSLGAVFLGKTVIIMPDADGPGIRHGKKIADSLAKRGIEYFTVDFGKEGVKDVTEFIQNDHIADDLVGLIPAEVVFTSASTELVEIAAD